MRASDTEVDAAEEGDFDFAASQNRYPEQYSGSVTTTVSAEARKGTIRLNLQPETRPGWPAPWR